MSAAPDDGVIRLRPEAVAVEGAPPADASPLEEGARRGFDYPSFVARLESLWFQRKALIADRRFADAERQSELIRDFCAEEGVRRLHAPAAALIAEARRHERDGDHARALSSLALAEALDPDRAQTHFARASVLWHGGRGGAAAALEALAGLRLGFAHGVRSLSLVNELALVLVVAFFGALLVFAALMLVRHHVPFRHEVEEWLGHVADGRWGPLAGWAALLLPLLLWFSAGWAAFYWILITFRFMRRGERIAAVWLLAACALAVPAHRVAVAVYGRTADPVFRATVHSAKGGYDPDRILELRQLVRERPDDATYRFLLARMYRNGRYLEEAFDEYRAALAIDPAMEQAHVNIGNLFFATGQFAEAIARYRQALEIRPDSVVTWFNLHLAQSEAFRFAEAEQSLEQARRIDSAGLAELLQQGASGVERGGVIDVSLELASVWEAALGSGAGARSGWSVRHFVNPVSVVAILTLLGCAISFAASRHDAVACRCIRCGRPFCGLCKSARQGREYCSQCLHLYVLCDGLAPETKTRKLYEVERHEKLGRLGRRLLSLLLPGGGHLLGGRAGSGALLVLLWIGAWFAWLPAQLAPLGRWIGADVQLGLLRQESVPAGYEPSPAGILAVGLLLTVWLVANLRRRGA